MSAFGIRTPYYFLSKAWRTTKLGVATSLTLVSGGVLVYGALTTGGAFNVIMGIIGLAGSSIIFIDSSKVHNDIAKAMEKNEVVISNYREENRQHHDENEAQRTENRRLHEKVNQLDRSLKKSVEQTTSLERIQRKYVDALQRLEVDLKREHGQVEQLSERVRELDELRAQYVAEIDKLSAAVSDSRSQVDQLRALYERAAASDQAHKLQIAKLKLIVESSQQVLLAVAEEGDRFEQFGKAIDTNLIKMDQQAQSFERTAEVMDRLLNGLTVEKFGQLDANNDGVVTFDEFEAAVSKKQETS